MQKNKVEGLKLPNHKATNHQKWGVVTIELFIYLSASSKLKTCDQGIGKSQTERKYYIFDIYTWQSTYIRNTWIQMI